MQYFSDWPAVGSRQPAAPVVAGDTYSAAEITAARLRLDEDPIAYIRNTHSMVDIDQIVLGGAAKRPSGEGAGLG